VKTENPIAAKYDNKREKQSSLVHFKQKNVVLLRIAICRAYPIFLQQSIAALVVGAI